MFLVNGQTDPSLLVNGNNYVVTAICINKEFSLVGDINMNGNLNLQLPGFCLREGEKLCGIDQ